MLPCLFFILLSYYLPWFILSYLFLILLFIVLFYYFFFLRYLSFYSIIPFNFLLLSYYLPLIYPITYLLSHYLYFPTFSYFLLQARGGKRLEQTKPSPQAPFPSLLFALTLKSISQQAPKTPTIPTILFSKLPITEVKTKNNFKWKLWLEPSQTRWDGWSRKEGSTGSGDKRLFLSHQDANLEMGYSPGSPLC